MRVFVKKKLVFIIPGVEVNFHEGFIFIFFFL